MAMLCFWNDPVASTQKIALSEKRVQSIIWTLLLLMPLAGVAIDLVAPALPGMAKGLQVTDGKVKDVISLYLFGYGFGSFVAGFLADAFGRQKLLRLGLFSFVIVSFLPILLPNIEILLSVRLLQGIALSMVIVASRTIFTDILPAEKLVAQGTLLAAMWGLGPVIGPVMGGYLQFYLGWKACFYFFVITALPVFILVFLIVPETHFNRHPLSIKTIKNNLAEVFTHGEFIAISALMGLTYSLIISFHTSAPFLIQNKFHYSPVFFGHLALYLGMAYLIATFICRYLLKKFNFDQLMPKLIGLFLLITLLSIGLSYIFVTSIVLLAITSAFMFAACGLIYPLSIGKGLSLLRHIAGTATATMYLVNVSITGLTAFLLSFINIQSITAMFWVYFILMIVSGGVYWCVKNRNNRE